MHRPAGLGALEEIAKLLSAGFDLTRVQDGLLDAVGEMVGPSRSSLLREDGAARSFAIAAQRGMTTQVVQSLRLPSDRGLPLWLAREGRPVHADEVEARGHEAAARDVARELTLLRAVVAVPLVAQGQLVAILALGRRVVGTPYRRDEIETLFDLGSRAATAIRDLGRHHDLRDERAYMDQVVSQLPSGVVCIDQRQRVVVFNRRAEQMLALARADALDRDLRCLPSPLGDLLYDALRTGRVVDRAEVQLVHPRLVLDLSARPIAPAGGPAAGALIVFEDVTAARALAAQKRERELFELLAGVVRRLADEVRRPLESLRTAMDRAERDEAPAEWSEESVALVRRDARRLVETTEMLSALVGEPELSFELVDLRKVVEGVFDQLDAHAELPPRDGVRRYCFTDPTCGKRALADLETPEDDLAVKCDRRELGRAIAYLVWYLVRHATGDQARLSISVGSGPGATGRRHVLCISGAAEQGPDDLTRMFDPLAAAEGRVIDVGPSASGRIFEAHGGRLQARARAGRLEFHAELPDPGAALPARRVL